MFAPLKSPPVMANTLRMPLGPGPTGMGGASVMFSVARCLRPGGHGGLAETGPFSRSWAEATAKSNDVATVVRTESFMAMDGTI